MYPCKPCLVYRVIILYLNSPANGIKWYVSMRRKNINYFKSDFVTYLRLNQMIFKRVLINSHLFVFLIIEKKKNSFDGWQMWYFHGYVYYNLGQRHGADESLKGNFGEKFTIVKGKFGTSQRWRAKRQTVLARKI